MKRIETVVSPAMRDKVVSAIKQEGVGGVTIWHTQGQGAAEPPLVGQYFSKEAIVTVVSDSKVDTVLNAIANVAVGWPLYCLLAAAGFAHLVRIIGKLWI